MQILIVRHGIAEEREPSSKSGQDDALRELTKAGQRKLRKAAKGLRQIVPGLDVIASSPLVRAMQSAEVLAAEYEGVRTLQVGALAPRKAPAALVEWLNAHPPDATVALVGHEPHLGTFVCWLMTGLQESFLELKKGGAILLDAGSPVAAGRAKLCWMLKPGQLRRMRK